MTSQIDHAFAVLTRKLERFSSLDDADRNAIRALPLTIGTVPPGTKLVTEGDLVADCTLLLTGYAFRLKLTPEGNRQIVSFHCAGDVLDLQHILLARADHGLETLTEATVARMPIAAMKSLVEERRRIGEALWRDTLIDASVFREWVLNVGRRDAKARIAHMLCEFAVRREAAGLGSPEQFDLPMGQEHIADATGLTPVHVSRVLAALANEGVIACASGSTRINDWRRLSWIGDFAADYLHMAA